MNPFRFPASALVTTTFASLSAVAAPAAAPDYAALTAAAHAANLTTEPIAPGPFAPTWDSLKAYQIPEWFRDGDALVISPAPVSGEPAAVVFKVSLK